MAEREYQFYVYLLSSLSRSLYAGVTNNLRERVAKHREMVPGTHTQHYKIWRLVYFERYQYVKHAIAREKEIKSWTRAKKVELIGKVNPAWEDLGAEW
jgi:putative endonuclease